jgi:dTDP-4-dehydrorhamnose reductase
MRLFITGISGLLGLNVALVARERVEVGGSFFSHPVSADGLDVYAADARDQDAMTRVLERARPDVILHTVGLSNVDGCEDDPEHAYELNVATAREGARLARACGARFIHVSTDHLFDGERAWRREDDALAPRNVYAKTKGEAEHAVLREHPDALVVRTNFYGWGTSVRTSFSDWVLRGLTEGRPLTMFADVHFTPILVNDLAELLLSLIEAKASGLIHVAGGERVSKYEYAVRAAEVFGLSADRVRAVPADSVMLRAPRPRDMSLACGRAETILGRPMPSLRDGLLRLRALRGQGWPRVLQAAVDAGKG